MTRSLFASGTTCHKRLGGHSLKFRVWLAQTNLRLPNLTT